MLAGLDGGLLAGAAWGLAGAALLPVLPARALGSRVARMALARLLAIAASLALSAVGALALAGISPAPLEWWPGLPGEPFSIGADPLAAPFLLLLGLIGAVSFAAHGPESETPSLGARLSFSLHAGFVLALAAVFGARHALLFLLAWEGMTLLSAALVARDSRSARARGAVFTYLALSHAGAAFMAVGLFWLSGRAGSFAFADLARAYAALPPRESAMVAWLMTIGFVVKLGLAPVHVWLPMAHPEAPAPISALLSGAMVKAGLYGLLRFAWQMPGSPPARWGEVLMALGVLSALTGALYAMVESDAKRLLAYSTVKHAGLLALMLGLAALLAGAGQPALAGVALAACLYHTIGHGLSKALAFLSVGEAVHAAGTRSLESLGGLARRLPRLSVAALVATLSLGALPPLACFAGEWLLFQALILGFSAGAGDLRLLAPFAGAGVALASALTVAAMVKLYGIGFLGRPRSAGAAAARPAPAPAEWAILSLAALTAVWGLGAPWAVRALGTPLVSVLGSAFDPASLAGSFGLTLVPARAAFSSVSPLAVTLLLALFVAIPLGWTVMLRLRPAVRRAPSWACGGVLDARMQYSALGFTKPLRLIFRPLLNPERELEVLEEGSPYFARKYRYRSTVPPLIERTLYQPLVQSVLWCSEQARALQAGNLRHYLAYLLVTLVALLVWAR